jgi:hypothetical protein
MIFSPRDYQGDIIRHIVENRRCAIWAGMGTGKSASTLTALDALDLIEVVYPALVIAPLRVAASVWPDEVGKWDHLRHLRVSPIVGNVSERIRALREPAEIYTVNYENLPWLVEHLGGGWRFPTVVADESTKLKGFRLRQGTQRARALGSVAHDRIERFIELTGTPAPNGLADLWGQSWFLDAGSRLGRTHSAFTDRWFRLKYDGYGLEPLAHAQGEIQTRLADLCLTITAADYFDLPPLIENEIKVDLPAPARRIYRDMEQAMFAQIEGHDVEAFNAAAKTNKCLQLANGAAYVDDRGTWKEVHDAKLAALEDIVLARVVALKTTPIPELKQLWRDLFDTEPPAYNRRFLENRLSYRLQELAHGGLKTSTIKRLEQLGEQLDGGKAKVRGRRTSDRPVAGTTLIREWQGTAYEVMVHSSHFEFQGQRYQSLSAIAKAITGTVWNGWAFFGLRSRRNVSAAVCTEAGVLVEGSRGLVEISRRRPA